MLRKLIKYDIKAMLRLWWIAAAVALLLSVVGAGCVRILASERDLPSAINVVAVLTLFVVILGWMAFGIASAIITYGRYYKNFFTDEGYLTFTLPVTRGQLINSKLISMYCVNFLTGLTVVVCFLTMFGLGINDFLPEFFRGLFESIKELWDLLKEEKLHGWLIVWLVEGLLIVALVALFNLLFTTNCITFGSIVAKKAKLAASIGIYFGANWLFSGALQILYMFGLSSLGIWLSSIDPEPQIAALIVAMLLFCAVAVMGLLCSLLYTLKYWMLDRKLNLP